MVKTGWKIVLISFLLWFQYFKKETQKCVECLSLFQDVHFKILFIVHSVTFGAYASTQLSQPSVKVQGREVEALHSVLSQFQTATAASTAIKSFTSLSSPQQSPSAKWP